MPDLEIIEAKAPVRAVRMEQPQEEATVRFAPLAGILSGPIFTRARDIIAANVNELLDRSEDPARMIRQPRRGERQRDRDPQEQDEPDHRPLCAVDRVIAGLEQIGTAVTLRCS